MIQTKLFAIATPKVQQEFICRQTLDKLCHSWPWLVPGVREVAGNLFVDRMNQLFLQYAGRLGDTLAHVQGCGWVLCKFISITELGEIAITTSFEGFPEKIIF